MKLGTIKRISKEDMSKKGQVPEWMDPLLETLNDFIEKITQALNGNLSFDDNILSKTIEQEFTHAAELIISPDVAGRSGVRPYGVFPIASGGEVVDAFSWRLLDTGKIGVTINFSTATDAKCKLIILLR